MLKLTRYLATRLRRLATSAPNSHGQSLGNLADVPNANAWDRLDVFITAHDTHIAGLRERELACESARAAITLIGQDGPRLAERVAELHEQGVARAMEPTLLTLTLAQAHGDARTRQAALRALSRVARVRARLTPPGVQREGAKSQGAARQWRA